MTLSAWNSIQYDLFTYHGWLAQSIFNIRGTKKSLRSKNLWDSWPCYLSGSLQNISRIWGQSPKRQNVVFSQFSTINALGERQWLPRDLIWRIKFLSKSATDLCWTDVVVQSWYCWESLGHELCVLLHIHVLQLISLIWLLTNFFCWWQMELGIPIRNISELFGEKVNHCNKTNRNEGVDVQ